MKAFQLSHIFISDTFNLIFFVIDIPQVADTEIFNIKELDCY